ncbi:hypothetical protein DL771_005156 [Monosporascus sp. 5C6A]|nr:hypothetical protein DL771_005156 [Monosporascus sp. 5C6A]
MASGPSPHQQYVSGVSAQHGAQVAAGIFHGNVKFGSPEDSQKDFEKKVTECRNALDPCVDPNVDREKLISTKGMRVAGTCEWIRENEAYKSWLYGDVRLLWISGGPGKGKTMLSIFVTEELEEITQSMEDARLLFYFCSHQDEKRNTAVAVLRGLVHQIVEERPKLIKLAQDDDLSKMFCVLDGLDECDKDTLSVLVPKIVDLFSPKNSQPAIQAFKLAILAAAIDIRSSSTLIDTERAIRDKIALCGPSLKVQEQEVGLVHQSARDYLLRKERDSDAVLEEFPKLFDVSKPFFHKDSDLRENWWRAYAKGRWPCHKPPLLHVASHCGIVPWVQEILTKRGWIFPFRKLANKKDITGRNPLSYAAEQGHEAVARLLLDRGADVNAEDVNVDGETALILAAKQGHEAVARLLLDRGAEVNAKSINSISETALIGAVRQGHEAVARLLLDRGADINAEYWNYQTPLMLAAFEGHEAVVRLLLNCGADVNTKNPYHQTPLMLAAKQGHEAVVRLLLDRGADVNMKSRYDHTPLMLAAFKGHEAVVRLLLDCGADVNTKDQYDQTPLILAVSEGQEAVVRLLLDYEADVNAKNAKGWTALQRAAAEGHEGVVRMLKSAGAS